MLKALIAVRNDALKITRKALKSKLKPPKNGKNALSVIGRTAFPAQCDLSSIVHKIFPTEQL